MTDQSIEAEIQAKGKTAPRVTPDDIQREIVGEHYFTAEQGARHPDAQNPLDFGDIPGNLGLLTFCVLRLRNGFTVTGESACASPENFDAAIGRRIARENAVQKIWPLLGFRLRDKLAGINDPSKAERVLGEVLSVVQHYLPPDGGTAHDAMGKIIGLVDPWPLGAASAAAALLSSAGVDSGHMDSTAPASREPSPLEVAAEEYARAEQNLSMAKLRVSNAQKELEAAHKAQNVAEEVRAGALSDLADCRGQVFSDIPIGDVRSS
jgi:Phage protein (N4 Gp49/phage Sf6 gene 66) family